MTNQNDILSIAVFFVVLAHAVLTLGVSFEMPEIAQRDNSDNYLDVVLINSASDVRDETAETISTRDNAGGGEAEESPSTPLDYKPTPVSPLEMVELRAKSQALTQSNQELMTVESGNVTIQADQPELVSM